MKEGEEKVCPLSMLSDAPKLCAGERCLFHSPRGSGCEFVFLVKRLVYHIPSIGEWADLARKILWAKHKAAMMHGQERARDERAQGKDDEDL